jgi:hypothetical protein
MEVLLLKAFRKADRIEGCLDRDTVVEINIRIAFLVQFRSARY